MKYVNVLLGDSSLSLGLNTAEKDNFIFSGNCGNCTSPSNFTLDNIDAKSPKGTKTITVLNHTHQINGNQSDQVITTDVNYTLVHGVLNKF